MSEGKEVIERRNMKKEKNTLVVRRYLWGKNEKKNMVRRASGSLGLGLESFL